MENGTILYRLSVIIYSLFANLYFWGKGNVIIDFLF